MLLCTGEIAGATLHLIVNDMSNQHLDLWLYQVKLGAVWNRNVSLTPRLLLSSQPAGTGRDFFPTCLSTFAGFPFRLRLSFLQFALLESLFWLPHFASLNMLVIEQLPVIARINRILSVKSHLCFYCKELSQKQDGSCFSKVQDPH